MPDLTQTNAQSGQTPSSNGDGRWLPVDGQPESDPVSGRHMNVASAAESVNGHSGEPLQPLGIYGPLLPAIVGAALTENGTVLDGEAILPLHLGFTADRKNLVLRRHDGELAFVIPHPFSDKFMGSALQSAGVSTEDLSGLTANVREAFGIARTFRKASTIIPRRVDFLWDPYIPRRALTILAGDGGVAKSMSTATIAGHVTTGAPFPGGWQPMQGEPSNVLMLTAEDDPDEVVTPRLMAVGAHLDRITIRGFDLNDDLYLDEKGLKIIEWQAQHTGPKLIVVDPVVSFMGDKIDMHRANEIRPILRRLGALAVKLDCAVVVVAHVNKDEAKKAGNRLAGTADFRNGARSLLLAGKIDDEPERGRAIFHNKANYAKEGSPIGYTLEETGVTIAGKNSPQGFTRWQSTDLTEAEVFGGKRQGRPQKAMIEDLIHAYLDQQPGHKADSGSAKLLIRAVFPKVSEATISRACQELGIIHNRDSGGGSVWELAPGLRTRLRYFAAVARSSTISRWARIVLVTQRCSGCHHSRFP